MEVIKGRMYDYNNGRFLSVDPFIQNPTSTQSMNPYTYIFNNPLSGVDPSGYAAVRRVDGNISYGSVCVEGMGCTGVGGGGGWQKETDNGFDMSDFLLGGSTGNRDPSEIKTGNGKTVGIDFSEYVKQKAPQERWDELSWGQKILSFFSPTVAMNASEQQAQVESWCGDGGCSRDYTKKEVENSRELARQFAEYTERVIGWMAGNRLTANTSKQAATRTLTVRVATKTWESTDNFVAETANAIEAKYPGLVVGVEVKIYRLNRTVITDFDIQLKNAIIQVKTGGKGMAKQLRVSEELSGLPAYGYGPKLKLHVLKNTNSTRDINTLLKWVNPNQ